MGKFNLFDLTTSSYYDRIPINMNRGIEILRSYTEQVKELQPDHPDLEKLNALIAHGQDLIAGQIIPKRALKQTTGSEATLKVEQPLYVIPENVGIRFNRNIGGKNPEQLEAEVKSVRNVGGYALDIIHSPKFATLEEVTPVELIKLRVQDLGLSGIPTTTQVFERATHSRIGNMALELCRAEVGLHQAIADTEQPLNDVYYIAHEPIAGRGGRPFVFSLGRGAGGLWLGDDWAGPEGRWGPGGRLVFALRHIEPVKA